MALATGTATRAGKAVFRRKITFLSLPHPPAVGSDAPEVERAEEEQEEEAEETLQAASRRYEELKDSGPSFLLTSGGREEEASGLELALGLQWRMGFPRPPRGMPQLTNGRFHYPAGMQPAAALALLRRVHRPREPVMDPFCGGGTVLVEARRCGRAAFGCDVSPLAAFVASMQAAPPGEGHLEEAREVAREVIELAKAGECKHYGSAEHLKCPENWEAIRGALVKKTTECASSNEALRCLWFAYASALDHGSRRKSPEPIKHFNDALSSYARSATQLLRTCSGTAKVALGDAREMASPFPFTSLVTSIPYPGVYKYQSHARRVRANMAARLPRSLHSEFLDAVPPDGRDWPSDWVSGEVGDRKRAKKQGDDFLDAWQQDQRAWMSAQAECLNQGGRMSIVSGDGEGIDSLARLRDIASSVELQEIAFASISAEHKPRRRRQPGRRRTEHILLVEKPHRREH